MSTLEFDLDQMKGLAGKLQDIGSPAGDAGRRIGRVDASGLPPEIAGVIEGEIRMIGRLLLLCDQGLETEATYLNDVASKVHQLESMVGDDVGLKLLKGSVQIAPLLQGMNQRERRTVERLVRGLNSIAGVGSLNAVVKWREFRRAVDATNPRRGASLGELVRAGFNETARRGVGANALAPEGYRPVTPENEGLGRLGRMSRGIVPVLGTGADGWQLKSDAKKFGDEFGFNAKTGRNFVAVQASALHNASNFVTPFFPPAAVVTEGAAWAGDLAVLGYDLASNPDQVNDLIEGAGHVAEGVYRDPIGAAEDVGKGIAGVGEDVGKGLKGVGEGLIKSSPIGKLL